MTTYTPITRFLLSTILIISLTASCRKLVEVDAPNTNPTDKTAFNSNATAASVITGIYIRMIQGDAGLTSGNKSISMLCGLTADELKNYSTNPYYPPFYTNNLSATSSPFWAEFYQYIYTANAAIEGLLASTGVSSEVKAQLLGEAYFIRAYCYFYLVNLFGEIPINTVTDYRVTATATRSPIGEVYKQIIKDLKEAQGLLSDDYKASDNSVTTERTRPNKAATNALLARVYLFQKNYNEAEKEATSVIDNSAFFSLETDLNNVFLGTSLEAIWQLVPVSTQGNPFDAKYFVLKTTPGKSQPAALSSELYAAFESNDQRAQQWIGSYTQGANTYFYPYKYKIASSGQPVTEYLMVLRLAEQYLIRAEARAYLGNNGGALDDLNAIRTRAGLPPIETLDKDSLIAIVQQERRVELFTEWGHRWLDLKRTGKVNDVMSIVTSLKGGTWSPNWQLYPLPIAEIQNNPNIHQNPGY